MGGSAKVTRVGDCCRTGCCCGCWGAEAGRGFSAGSITSPRFRSLLRTKRRKLGVRTTRPGLYCIFVILFFVGIFVKKVKQYSSYLEADPPILDRDVRTTDSQVAAPRA